jgi:hypothetical protein
VGGFAGAQRRVEPEAARGRPITLGVRVISCKKIGTR